jgi:hypothetical protein
MKSIFDDSNSIYVNPAWVYNETDHKWTIDENDVIVHTELSEEIYSDFHKLDQYNLVLEEACEAYNKLTDQIISNNNILDNHKITVEHISLSNECLSICKTKLGYDVIINRSNESDMTNYERLVVSNEGIIDFIKELIAKIKELFKKVWNFFKNLFIKILRWLGLWEDKLDKMHKEVKVTLNNSSNEDLQSDRENTLRDMRVKFNNIWNDDEMVITSDAISKIIDLFPLSWLSLKDLETSTFIDLFNLLNFKDILSPVTDEIDKTLKCITDGKLKNLNDSKFSKGIIKYMDKILKDDKLAILLITKVTDKTIAYLQYNTDENKITKYITHTIQDQDLNIDINHILRMSKTICKKDIDEMFHQVLKVYMPCMNLYEQKIKNLHRVLDNHINSIDKSLDKADNSLLKKDKENLQIIRDFGSVIPLDIIKFMKNMIDRYTQMLTIVHSDIVKNEQDLNKYKKLVEQEDNNLLTGAKLEFMFGKKEFPYIKPDETFWASSSANDTFYGFCFQKNLPTHPHLDLKGIICLDKDQMDGKVSRYNFKDFKKETWANVVYDAWKELIDVFNISLPEFKEFTHKNYSDVRLDNFKNANEYYEAIGLNDTNSAIYYLLNAAKQVLLTMKISEDLFNAQFNKLKDIINKYYNYDNEDSSVLAKLTPKQQAFIYFHEMGHVIMKQPENPMYDSTVELGAIDLYVRGFTENQADAYAMIKTHMHVDDVVILRCCKLMPGMLPYWKEYRDNILKQVNLVSKFEKITNKDRALYKANEAAYKAKITKEILVKNTLKNKMPHILNNKDITDRKLEILANLT